MSYPKTMLRLRPTKGFASDTPPHEVGPDYWTAMQNVLTRDGFAGRVPGSRSAYGTALAIVAPGQFMHAVNFDFAEVNYWLLLEEDGSAWVIEGNNAVQVDNLLLSGVTSPFEFSSALLNGVPIVSNSTDEPVYFNGTLLETLPDWTATESCTFIAVLKYHVFALNISGPSGVFTNLVKWSDATEPGTVPGSWTPAADNEAGSAELSDSPGGLVCAYPLSDSLLIYKRSSIYQAQYVGGNNVFEIRKIKSNIGALGPRAVCDINGQHFIVSDGDIVLFDGVTVRSVGEARVKNYLFDQLDQTHYRNLFCTYNRSRDEVLIGYPTVGNEFCNAALVYDLSTDSFGVRDLPKTVHAPVGFINDELPSNTWADRTDVWADASDYWGSSALSAARDSLVLITTAEMVQQDVDVGVVVPAYVGKYSMSFGEPERVKFVRRVHMRCQANFGTLLVRVGSQQTPTGPTTWSPEVAITAPQQIVNTFAQGRYISIEVRSNDVDVWKLTALELEAELRGYF